jgi:hypothetical protein
MAKGNKPAATFSIGLVKATVWKNDGPNNRSFYNVRLSRSYKDDKDEWQDTDQLGHHDLLNAAALLQRAERYIAEEGIED